jgi:hypothetical protein
MRITSTILTILLASIFSIGQTRTVTGKVIGEYEDSPIPGVRIQNLDTVYFGTTDLNGNFKIDIPTGITGLMFIFLGAERTSVTTSPDCDYLEIIIMSDVIYDYVTIAAINRKRQRRYKKIKERHLEAFEKGIFKTKEPCVTYKYDSY